MKPEEQALFANDTFYLAFAAEGPRCHDAAVGQAPPGDLHPSGLAGHHRPRRGHRESWRRILGNPDQPGIDFYNANAQTVGSMVFVTCYEELPGSICVATNGFVSERGEMRIFHHQSGPCANPPPPAGPGGTSAESKRKQQG